MVLHIHSDTSYLSKYASSRLGGYLFLSSDPNSNKHIHIGPILAISTVYKNVLFSVMEAKVAGMFVNTKEVVHLKNIPKDMGHPHPQTLARTYSLTTFGIVSEKMKQHRSKAIDMNFYWINY
jgi:hypothetical protein